MAEGRQADSGREVSGFVRAQGSRLVNGDGREVVLRGVGLGGWLLPEGYMWKMPKEGDRPRRMEQLIERLIGADKAAQFWQLYFDRYTSKADIDTIAEEGFNSVRVPINARPLMRANEDGRLRFNEDHLALIDRVIDWCKERRLYVILDLHGAPGGQTGANIDDSERNRPDLFTEERNWRHTVELWRMLADRYKEEWIVAGYDLLNEPLPDQYAAYNSRIMPLYKEIVQAIREVDARHLIILEGVHWATDWSVFTEKIDDNAMLQFHKYWNAPDTESLRPYLDKREEWNVPIFMGEGGENTKEWYAGAFQLLEDHGISWNFWTWKKMDTLNSPCSVRMPAGWEALVRYAKHGEPLEASEAERILWAFLDHLPLERCEYHPEVVRALFRRAPVRVPAVYYGFKGAGVSFGIGARTDAGLDFRDGDGTNIRFLAGSVKKPIFRIGQSAEETRMCVQLAAGDWLAYDFTIKDGGAEAVAIRLQACPVKQGAGLSVAMNGVEVGCAEVLEEEGAWRQVEWRTGMPTASGRVRVEVRAQRHPVRLEWIELE